MANDTQWGEAFQASLTDKDVPAFGAQIPQKLCPQRIYVTTTFMPPILLSVSVHSAWWSRRGSYHK